MNDPTRAEPRTPFLTESPMRPPAEIRAKIDTLDKSDIKNEDFREADYWINKTLKWVLKESEEI